MIFLYSNVVNIDKRCLSLYFEQYISEYSSYSRACTDPIQLGLPSQVLLPVLVSEGLQEAYEIGDLFIRQLLVQLQFCHLAHRIFECAERSSSVYLSPALENRSCRVVRVCCFKWVNQTLVFHRVNRRICSRQNSAYTPSLELINWRNTMKAVGYIKSLEVILVVGAAGGVGSIFLQLAKAITGATIIATASRESSQAWMKKLGAHHVIDHTQPLQPQIEALGIGQVTHVASLNSTDSYFESYTGLLVPFGKIAMIDDPDSLDVMKLKLKPKSQSLHIEFMFARSMFKAADMNEQGRLLNRVSDLVDQGYIQTTVGKNLGTTNATT